MMLFPLASQAAPPGGRGHAAAVVAVRGGTIDATRDQAPAFPRFSVEPARCGLPL